MTRVTSLPYDYTQQHVASLEQDDPVIFKFTGKESCEIRQQHLKFQIRLELKQSGTPLCAKRIQVKLKQLHATMHTNILLLLYMQ